MFNEKINAKMGKINTKMNIELDVINKKIEAKREEDIWTMDKKIDDALKKRLSLFTRKN